MNESTKEEDKCVVVVVFIKIRSLQKIVKH